MSPIIRMLPRSRSLRMEQQPQRHQLNRAQQQQGSTEFQSHSTDGGRAAQQGADTAPRKPGATGDHRTGGAGGTPIDMPRGATPHRRDVQSYVEEASTNVDA